MKTFLRARRYVERSNSNQASPVEYAISADTTTSRIAESLIEENGIIVCEQGVASYFELTRDSPPLKKGDVVLAVQTGEPAKKRMRSTRSTTITYQVLGTKSPSGLSSRGENAVLEDSVLMKLGTGTQYGIWPKWTQKRFKLARRENAREAAAGREPVYYYATLSKNGQISVAALLRMGWPREDSMKEIKQWASPTVVYIELIASKSGGASVLLEKIAEFARSKNCTGVVLTAANTPLVPFYMANGFRIATKLCSGTENQKSIQKAAVALIEDPTETFDSSTKQELERAIQALMTMMEDVKMSSYAADGTFDRSAFMKKAGKIIGKNAQCVGSASPELQPLFEVGFIHGIPMTLCLK